MDLITFDALRSCHMGGVRYLKPETMYAHLDSIRAARGVIFPAYWQLNSLLYALRKPVFPSEASYRIGHDKVEMTRCFQAIAPQHTPYTLILSHTPSHAERAWDSMGLPFVAKIPRSSMGEGVFLIESRADWGHYLDRSPVIYVQEYLPIDRDLRIVWVGDAIVGGYWRTQSPQGFYNNVARGGQIEQGLIPLEARQLVEHLATSLGINHGGFDIAMVGSHPYVLEFNRLFGNQGLAISNVDLEQRIIDYLHRHWGEEDQPLHPEGGRRPPTAA
ncbi:ATP-grasp domain-containing protein [Motiliproteus sediminis]|uniref:ATP-grasp domain-containing protein n=1 Tax=Motiliproteus sediminis TaxID=1468178 RepID=UPI001AEFFDFB|nr:hypothetical protein [Motiliproteus sediminis]